MAGALHYSYSYVPAAEAETAFAFHAAQAAESADYLVPRNLGQVRAFAEAGHLFRAVCAGALVGLCYVIPAKEGDHDVWEFGGLTVLPTQRGRGVGTCMGVLALASTLLKQDPFKANQSIIAHVHAQNEMPRGMLNGVWFERGPRITYPGRLFPPGALKRNAAGDVEGDLFKWPERAIWSLRDWFDVFSGEYRGNRVSFDFGEGIPDIPMVREALNGMAVDRFGIR